PMEIWGAQSGVAREVLEAARVRPQEVAAIGITHQREATVVWERHTGEPVHPAIVWQDRRTADLCQRLKKDGWEPAIREKTGLIIDACCSATKLKSSLAPVGGARARAERGDLLFGTVDTWLVWNLTRGRVHATDYTNASRTMLFNIHTLEWDEDILRELGIPKAMLPEVRPSVAASGETDWDTCMVSPIQQRGID